MGKPGGEPLSWNAIIHLIDKERYFEEMLKFKFSSNII